MRFVLGGWLLLIVAAIAFFAFKRKSIIAAIDPTSDQNLAYQSANSVVSTITGRDETFGGWLAEIFDPSTAKVNELYGNGYQIGDTQLNAQPVFIQDGA